MKVIVHNGQTLAIIIPREFHQPGLSFFTDEDASMQLGLMCYPKSKTIQPHVHQRSERTISETQEVLFVRKGRLRVDFYNDSRSVVESYTLDAGDTILLLRGGHGFEILEDAEIIEAKTGPYLGERDKTRFDPEP